MGVIAQRCENVHLDRECTDISPDRAIPESSQNGDIVENADWYPDITIRYSISRWNRARGALLNGRGQIRVENCRLSTAVHMFGNVFS